MKTLSGLSRAVTSTDKAEQRFGFVTRSILLSDQQRMRPVAERGDDASRLPRSMPAAASTTSRMRSASCGAGPGRRDHRPVEPPARLEDARRVDQQDLRLPIDRDAHQPRARGLRLGADDRDLLPDQRIDQRRLAGIRGADHGDETGARFRFAHCSWLQQRFRGRGLRFLLAGAFSGRFARAADRRRGR